MKIKFTGPFKSKQELFRIGQIDGISIGCEYQPAEDEAERLLRLAQVYIGAYREFFEGEPPNVLNASYADNNLPYLFREWDEEDDLCRIAVPFSGEQNETVQDAQFIAGYRSLLEKEEGPTEENDEGPAVKKLLEIARKAWCG